MISTSMIVSAADEILSYRDVTVSSIEVMRAPRIPIATLTLDEKQRSALHKVLTQSSSYGERVFRSAAPEFRVKSPKSQGQLAVSLRHREICFEPEDGDVSVAFPTDGAVTRLNVVSEPIRRQLRQIWVKHLDVDRRRVLVSSASDLGCCESRDELASCLRHLAIFPPWLFRWSDAARALRDEVSLLDKNSSRFRLELDQLIERAREAVSEDGGLVAVLEQTQTL